MPASGRLSWLLLSCLLSCLMLAAVHEAEPTRPVSSPAATHSNFLRSALRGGRLRPMTCSYDPGVCLDRERNPWGGSTCCFGRFCKDTMNDADHCGGCGHRCAFGYACCDGQCADVRSDPRHCGSCHRPCPARVACSFAMCDYGGGGF